MKIYVLIPAAGSGTRMGKGVDKLFLDICGKTVIERTLEAFGVFAASHDVSCIIAAGEGNHDRICKAASRFPFVKEVITGGDTRTKSVARCVSALGSGPEDDDLVFVHDAARCLVSQDLLERCVSCCLTHDVCVAGVKAKNTIKITDGSGKVISTPPRDTLYEVQTPQCFRYHVIRDSYAYAMQNGIEATDDTALAEMTGREVYIVEGDYSNIKITTPEDIAIAASLITEAGS